MLGREGGGGGGKIALANWIATTRVEGGGGEGGERGDTRRVAVHTF